MKVIYEPPKKGDFRYKQWFDDWGQPSDIWYEEETLLDGYRDMDIPDELKAFLDDWNRKIPEYKKTFIERYPVKLSQIQFIYSDTVYAIYPRNVSATYTDVFDGEEFTFQWDSLFEEYETEIREDLEKRLGVRYSRYFGMLD